MQSADQQANDLAALAPAKSNSTMATGASLGSDDLPPEQQAGMNTIALQLSCMEHFQS